MITIHDGDFELFLAKFDLNPTKDLQETANVAGLRDDFEQRVENGHRPFCGGGWQPIKVCSYSDEMTLKVRYINVYLFRVFVEGNMCDSTH